MSIRLTRPTTDDLRTLIEVGRTASVTYHSIGMSAFAKAPDGYRLDRWSRTLGHGDRVFESATTAIGTWRVHRDAGLVVLAEGPPLLGSTVAMSAPLPVGYIDVVCRIVDVVDQPGRFGFAYGTLPVHPEQGEETFTIVRGAGEEIVFEITAASRLRHPLARACPPIARRLQRSATSRYLDAMTRAIES